MEINERLLTLSGDCTVSPSTFGCIKPVKLLEYLVLRSGKVWRRVNVSWNQILHRWNLLISLELKLEEEKQSIKNSLKNLWFASKLMGSGGEVVTSPPLNRKVGWSRPTMIRARCLREKQHYPAQKNNQKNLHVVLKQGHNSGSPWWAVQLLCWCFPPWINGLN